MQLVYLDESYERGDAYWLGACFVPAVAAPQLRDGFVAVAAALSAAAPEWIPKDVELHASQLFGGGGAFGALKRAPPLRLAGFRAGVQAMGAAGTRTVLVGVAWSPEDRRSAVRLHRMEAVRRLFPALEAVLADVDDEGLVIADEEEGTTRDVFAELQRHQQASGGSRLRDVVFVDSRFSPGVQGADLITFLHRRRHRKGNDPRAQAALDEIWGLVAANAAVHEFPAPLTADP